MVGQVKKGMISFIISCLCRGSVITNLNIREWLASSFHVYAGAVFFYANEMGMISFIISCICRGSVMVD